MNDTINRVIVPGTFDPITFGHIDVIRRARRIFPSVIVAVAESQGKNGVGTTFMLDERVALAREALGDLDGIEVLPFTGLLVLNSSQFSLDIANASLSRLFSSSVRLCRFNS